ncbi:glycoside hydrolase family 32 protein [Corynebacterium pseudogenitalium]|uniref:glycoside hydrolase family 32 protein n=1 Tax=Corynebacterium pseudogenitalium TaxID=38303 RepID=UPI00210C061A|nr:glycoside hydrolase family 32 protein [Corynebacterium pseudogenitalium]UUA86697.1 glycoside hydrolase family 32 protein [Corynebacterium pseudogenitalium]
MQPLRHTNDRWYPAFHVAAPGGWINDPNGLCFFDGRFHAFFQHHPYSPAWGPMHWGHASSADLLEWREEPIALAPGEPGSDDADGIWSGSAVVHDGTLYAFYTGNRWVNGVDDKDGKFQTQMLATSTDGVHFEKHGAVVPPVKADARDPKVFSHDGRWYMTIGAEVDGRGHVLLYTSEDLYNWSEAGSLFIDPDPNVFMVECPDFFFLDGKWVLIYGPMVRTPIRSGYSLRNGHNVGYVVGSWEPGAQFVPETDFRLLDWGHHFYATQSFAAPNNRRLAFGWMGEFAHPLASREDGWSGQLSLPRELSLSDALTLHCAPAPEIAELFGPAETHDATLQAGETTILAPLEEAWLRVTPDLDQPVPLQTNTCEQVAVHLIRDDARCAHIVFDTLAERIHLVLERGNGAGSGYRSMPWTPGDTLDIYLDRGSIELFTADATETLSSLDFRGEGPRTVEIESVAGPVGVNLEVRPLKRG